VTRRCLPGPSERLSFTPRIFLLTDLLTYVSTLPFNRFRGLPGTSAACSKSGTLVLDPFLLLLLLRYGRTIYGRIIGYRGLNADWTPKTTTRMVLLSMILSSPNSYLFRGFFLFSSSSPPRILSSKSTRFSRLHRLWFPTRTTEDRVAWGIPIMAFRRGVARLGLPRACRGAQGRQASLGVGSPFPEVAKHDQDHASCRKGLAQWHAHGLSDMPVHNAVVRFS
jgi:hypothetical protein